MIDKTQTRRTIFVKNIDPQSFSVEDYLFNLSFPEDWKALDTMITKKQISEGERYSFLYREDKRVNGTVLSSDEAKELGLYKIASMKNLRLLSTDLIPHEQIPKTGVKLVQVGDLLFSKFLPFSVALVTENTERRGVDSNCLCITRLKPNDAFLIAQTLQNPLYNELHLLNKRTLVAPRIGKKEVLGLRFPQLSSELSGFAAQWLDTADKVFEIENNLRKLQNDVDEWVEKEAGASLTEQMEPKFYSSSALDSWLPKHVFVKSYQNDKDRNWLKLGDILSTNQTRRSRVLKKSDVEEVYTLQLNDAFGDLSFQSDLAKSDRNNRIYAEPLKSKEVLLSLLGISPKVVYVQKEQEKIAKQPIFVSDIWARFTETKSPETLALLLQTKLVKTQLSLSVFGVAGQFVALPQLQNICIPWPEPHIEKEWAEKLIELLKKKSVLTKQMEQIYSDVQEIITQDLRRGRQ